MKREYGIVFRDKAPYEIISNRWIDSVQMIRLKSIEKCSIYIITEEAFIILWTI